MTKLLLVKHSLPIIDPHVSAATWQLGAEGIARCRRLADQLAYYLPAVLVCSSEPKAIATAASLADHWSIPFTTVAGLEEHHRATAPFRDDEQFQQSIHNLFDHPAELVFGEETADQAYLRFASTIDQLLNQHPTHSLIAVSHGTVMSLYLSRRFNREPFPLWKQFGLPSFVVVDRLTQSVEASTPRPVLSLPR